MSWLETLQSLSKEELVERIDLALVRAFATAQIDGAHHKAWTIDQMVRCLTGCPQNEYGQCSEESSEYQDFIEEYCWDDNGNEYSWEEGTPP